MKSSLITFFASLAVIFCVLPVVAQQPRRAAVASQNFDLLAGQAARAREGNRIDEAIGLYRKALAQRPQWDEGWWYLATLLYDKDSFREAAKAFQETTRLHPNIGAAWGMLGLCEFNLGQYETALEHLGKSRRLGLPTDNPTLARVIRYHEALILLRTGYFETAQTTFEALSYEGMNSKDLIQALGFSALRVQSLPGQIASTAVEVVNRLGHAQYLAAMKRFDEAKGEYDNLIKDFPGTHNVHYAYGRFLLSIRRDDDAVVEYQKELVVTPEHRLARLQIASIHLRSKNPSLGLPFVEQVLNLYPEDGLAHYLKGRLLLDMNRIEPAIRELEIAQTAYKSEPKLYYQLARAYARAKRGADAEKALATFTRLKKEAEAAPSGGAAPTAASGQTIEDESPEEAKPANP